jgi:hypothetical protein
MAASVHQPVGIGSKFDAVRVGYGDGQSTVDHAQRMWGQEAVVCMDVQTSVGRCAFPFQVDDQGSDRANEQEARRELQVFLQEALKALDEC